MRVVAVVVMLCLSGCTIIGAVVGSRAVATNNENEYDDWMRERHRIGDANAVAVVTCRHQRTATRIRADMETDTAARVGVLARMPDCTNLEAPLPDPPEEHSAGTWAILGALVGVAVDVYVVYTVSHAKFGPATR
jgi:hypothetical protein